jgi:hypothetical protein
MDLPELACRLGSILREFGGAPRIVALGDGAMPKDVPQSLSKSVPEVRDNFMHGVTAGAGVAAILDQGHVGLGISQDVIAADIDRTI